MRRKVKKCLTYLALVIFCVGYIIATHYFVQFYQDEHDIPELWQSTLNLFYPDDTSCYYWKGDYLMSIENEAVYPNSIFFHETSCQRNLGVREACSIEAAARSHTKRSVYVLFAKPLTKKECLRGPLAEVNKLANVLFSRVDVRTYALNTPLQDIFNKSLTSYGKRHHKRVAEYMKFLTLHRFGGMVVDLDSMLWASTEHFGDNWAVKEEDGKLGSAVISMSNENLGKKITALLLNALTDNINSTGIDGGQVLHKVLKDVCTASDFGEMNSSTACDGFKVYDSNLVYAYNHSNWRKYLVPGSPRSMSLGYHLWNSKDARSPPNESMYAEMAKRYCPSLFKKFSFAFYD